MIDIVWNLGLDASGYSNCARNYVKALYHNSRSNIKTNILNIAKNINGEGLDNKDIDFFTSLAIDRKDKNYMNVQHYVPDRFVLGTGKNILYTVAESKIPYRWSVICNQCDVVFTATNFCKEVMVESGVDENIIKIIPHCYDVKDWNLEVEPLNIFNLKDYNFLFIGDYTPRKGGDLLIKNYIKTFQGDKNVSLTIKSYYNSFSTDDQIVLVNRIKNIIKNSGIPSYEVPSIYFYGESILEKFMPRFIKSFDCLVSPHHGEGWGLSISQAQSLGIPVISTRYSGNLDFMNDDISYFVEIDGMENVCDEMVKINPNYEGMMWAKLNEDSLCESMKFVRNNKEDSIRKGEKASVFMSGNFNYEKISDQIIDELEKI